MGEFDEEKHPRGALGRWASSKLDTSSKLRSPKNKAKMKETVQALTKEYVKTMLAPVKDMRPEAKPGAVLPTLNPNVTVGGQIRIAKEVLGRHAEGFKAEESAMKSLIPNAAVVKGRVKELESALEKLVRKPKYGTSEGLQDATGLRVVMKNTKEVEAAVAKIKANYKVVAEDDYINKPQEGTGYRSHHLVVVGKDGLQKEVQVRTENQDKHGDWAHEAYKPHTPEQAAHVKENAKVISEYSQAVSNHFHDVDTGKKDAGPKPPCPPVIREHFGCL